MKNATTEPMANMIQRLSRQPELAKRPSSGVGSTLSSRRRPSSRMARPMKNSPPPTVISLRRSTAGSVIAATTFSISLSGRCPAGPSAPLRSNVKPSTAPGRYAKAVMTSAKMPTESEARRMWRGILPRVA